MVAVEHTSGNRLVAGRYALRREIGRGASGSVWLADDRQLRRNVALKLLLPEQLERSTAQVHFETEAQALAQVRSRNVVQIFDFGIDTDRPFIVMELLEGESLEARLRRHGRLSLTAVASIVSGIANGLTELHAKRIIHRDIKPANVFLARDSGLETAKLLDFGVSGRRNGPEDHAAMPPGTPRYMSPEHVLGNTLDPSTDVWSLAVVTYEMLTGRCPFQGDTLLALRRQVCAGAFEPASQRVRDLTPRVDTLFERALAKDSSCRLQSAEEFASELRRIVRDCGDPVARILFVDDEPDIEILLRQRFRHGIRQGTHELYFARDGESGLEQLRSRPDIDVVLTDLNMPGMNGLTFLSRVPEVNPVVRVVVVSAYGDMANIRAAMNLGAFDFLCKPIDFDDLENTIRRCVENVVELRYSLASREEADVIRLLLGQGVVERFVNVARTGVPQPSERFLGSVAALTLPSSPRSGDAALESELTEASALFQALAAELLTYQGQLAEFNLETAVVVFRGEQHREQAIDFALALRARFMHLAATEGLPSATSFKAGIASGTLLWTSLGSHGLGRIEQLLLGEPPRRATALRDSAHDFEIFVSAEDHDDIALSFRCGLVGPRNGVDTSATRIDARTGARTASAAADGPPSTVDLVSGAL